jgi:hypothetical protein
VVDGGGMTTATIYEIVIRGHASARFLRPLIDDFVIDHSVESVTRVTGLVRDPSHLFGIVAHLTSVGAELVSIASLAPHLPATNETSNQS